MVTINKKLRALTDADIDRISDEYLRGWHNLNAYGFRLRGLNNERQKRGLDRLDVNKSILYRISYVKDHYIYDDIVNMIDAYMREHRMSDMRYVGIDIFNCRFGSDYNRIFKELLGKDVYDTISEKNRVLKLVSTQYDLYGGVGLAGEQTQQKAMATNLATRGVDNPRHDPTVVAKINATNVKRYGGLSPFSSQKVRDKAMLSRINTVKNDVVTFKKEGVINDDLFKDAPYEKIVFYELVNRFGKDDVYYQYGRHPYDERYPYNCDFYIKSLDLFIELNSHYSHGSHWYDATDHDDVLRVSHLMASNSRRSRLSVTVWTETDVEKRQKAKHESLNYLVFWDHTVKRLKNKPNVPNLKDFYKWLHDYDANYAAFIKDYPENSY